MGNIYSALRELQALKAGTSNVTGVYVGTNLIWPLITPTPTITPTSTFTPTPTSTPTVTPTNTQTPTTTSTNTPTNTPTQTVTPTPSGVVPTITYITNLTSDVNLISYTFSNVNWGSAGFIVVAAAGRQSSAASVTSVTIGGISATLLVGREGTNNRIALYGATMTGTSGNIVITFSQGQVTAGIGVWRLNNLKSTTPVSTNSNTSNFVATISMNLTANTGTNVIICAQSMGSGSNATISSSTTTRNYTATSEIVYAQAGFSDITTTSGTYTFTSNWVNTGSPSNPGSPTIVGVIFQ
jgi:hypothetical protein